MTTAVTEGANKTTIATERDIETWTYSTWDEIVGNRRLKTRLQRMVQAIAGPSRGRGINTLVLGPSRSGKTSTIEFALKAMMCWHLDFERLVPCGECRTCVEQDGRYKMVDLDLVRWGGQDQNLCFVPIDGNRITADDLDKEVREAAGRCQYRWIYYIDEIQGLVRRHLDHALFKAVEQYKHVTWIVSTATTQGLDQMFRNRFTEVTTELPTVDELAVFLARRCRHQAVNLRWDSAQTLLRLAERCKRVPGLALKCLAQAKMYGGVLIREDVEDYQFEQIEM